MTASLLHRARFRVSNALLDLRDRLRGYCCAKPVEYGSAWYFWRCGLRRGHEGLHRVGNYLWSDDGKSMYTPVNPCPPVLNRAPVLTRRQRHARDRWEREHGITQLRRAA